MSSPGSSPLPSGRPVEVPGNPYSEPEIDAIVPTFPLTQHDFEQLEQRNSPLSAIAGPIATAAIGALFPTIGKWVQNTRRSEFEKAIPIEDWEWQVPVIIVGVAVLLYCIGWLFNPRRELRKRIKAHFNARPRRHRHAN